MTMFHQKSFMTMTIVCDNIIYDNVLSEILSEKMFTELFF